MVRFNSSIGSIDRSTRDSSLILLKCFNSSIGSIDSEIPGFLLLCAELVSIPVLVRLIETKQTTTMEPVDRFNSSIGSIDSRSQHFKKRIIRGFNSSIGSIDSPERGSYLFYNSGFQFQYWFD